MKTHPYLFYIVLSIFSSGLFAQKRTINAPAEILNIGAVPADFPVKFTLLTRASKQFVAYYDTAHQLTIACRRITSNKWNYQKLDSKVGWDSHNYISLATDKHGFIHLSGNMHSSPLIYFRSSKPYDIQSFVKIDSMTGKDELITTYPEFITNRNGDLIFHYRYGRSGNGYEVYNIWNSHTQQWKRLLSEPLTDGEKLRNAYMQGPVVGKDGYYHLIWVWRESPDCSTNHTLSYARSKDLLHWESIRGEKVNLPITLRDSVLIVDDTPVKGGLINIGIQIGFDSENKILIGYHKYDKNGKTQLYITRFENNKWVCNQLTNWDYRWDFKGMGTIVNELLLEAPKTSYKKGELIFGYHQYAGIGDGQVIIDQKSLKVIRTEAFEPDYPNVLNQVQSAFPGMLVNVVADKGNSSGENQFFLRWETLSPNRDIRRTGNLPPPSVLQLVQIHNSK